jgi:hypothetical protein
MARPGKTKTIADDLQPETKQEPQPQASAEICDSEDQGEQPDKVEVQEKPQSGRGLSLVNPDGTPKQWVILPSINSSQLEFLINGIENAGYELTEKYRNPTGSWDLFFKRV